MKTNVKLKVFHDGREDYCRVKLDSKKFPFIVIDNEKIVIKDATFPRTVSAVYGLKELRMELIDGEEELKQILANPDLTADKLDLRQQMRLA